MSKTKFVLIGQPRSGTTFLISLLAHTTNAYCENELFNPYRISFYDASKDKSDSKDILERESSPVQFIENFFDENLDKKHSVVGFNFMLGHNVEALNYILSKDDIKIIYLRRDNKVAQYASWKKALESKAWATRSEQEAKQQRKNKIQFSVEDYNEHQNPISFLDHAFTSSLDKLDPQRVFKIEYRELFDKGKQDQLLKFINAKQIVRLQSDPIKKQGNNAIADRFENNTFLKTYLTALKQERWMGTELNEHTYEKFVLIAQTRTGSNYLMTEINNRTTAFCDGELFNPKQICHFGDLENTSGSDSIIARDADPIKFIDEFYNQKVFSGEDAIGFKFMLGHSFNVFDYLIENTNFKIIYLHRENKLAQFASFQAAVKSNTWVTQNEKVAEKIQQDSLNFDMGTFINQSGTLQSLDYLTKLKLSQIDPSRVLEVEYTDMFEKDFIVKIKSFLGAKGKKGANKIQKQGLNTIIDRFSNQGAVKNYFERTNKSQWLGEEIKTTSS